VQTDRPLNAAAGGRRGIRDPAAGPHRVPGDRADAAARRPRSRCGPRLEDGYLVLIRRRKGRSASERLAIMQTLVVDHPARRATS